MAYNYPFENAPEEKKLEVWRKGQEIDGYDKDIWRKDAYGSAMKYSEHGNRNSKNGWEIDHITPISQGGNDDLANLQPLQWENNLTKGDS
jgi:5-methylcytosine-specific restriction endonuclease McrA